MGIPLDQLSPALQARIRAQDAASKPVVPLSAPEPMPTPTKAERGMERVLQGEIESWLTLHHFRRRTREEIMRDGECAGWFLHLHTTQRNPIILDILILHANGSFQEIEIKTISGRVEPHQAKLIERGGILVRSLVDFIRAVEQHLSR